MEQGELVAERATSRAEARAGLYLTFVLGSETYGIEILKVQEIIGMMRVTAVPKTPEFVRGVINLRGRVIPVVDLRRKFGMESKGDTDRTCVIVLQVARVEGHVTMGIIVDEVAEVVDVAGEQIEPPPTLGAGVRTEFVLGMGKIEDAVVILLDVNRVLSDDEMEVLQEVQPEGV
jgi:purine-binding chemotaxis protein CheW